MRTFTHHLTEAQNTHMTHVEDLLFDGGLAGARAALTYLKSVRDMLAGHTSSRVSLSAKWDGAPAIFVGIDPADQRYFVAKKGLFNKVPVVYKSHEAIDRELTGDLAQKFHLAFDAFRALGLTKGVIQGDLLFTASDLHQKTIDDQTYLVFQPNTIAYAVPVGTPLAAKLAYATIGVVWHTRYSGSDLSHLTATFNVAITPELKKTPRIWQVDAAFKDLSGRATMSAETTRAVTAALAEAGRWMGDIPAEALRAIVGSPKTVALIAQHNNAAVRSGTWLSNPETMAHSLLDFVTAKTADATPTMKTTVLAPLAAAGLPTLIAIYGFLAAVSTAKIHLVRQLDTLAQLDTFLQTAHGYEVTAPEGYVAVDRLGSAVKLVDRLQFSRANFSPDVIKGWTR